MCGIAGFIDYQRTAIKNTLTQITELLHHRGPDDTGYFFKEASNYHVGLGHKRLSIIDVSSCGHQPMHFDTLSIVYNGEIYNYESIQQELLSEGYTFQSTSDTEVVLKSLHRWGLSAISKFIGMFSIALHNATTDELFLIRDRIGVKPLYYYYDQQRCVFASELKSIMAYPGLKKEVNKDVLNLYLYHGYITAPYSILQHVYKIQPGTYLRLHNQQVSTHTYWDLKEEFRSNNKYSVTNETEALMQLEEIVNSAVSYRMIADVPVGAFLSGGYDSSLVTAVMQRISNKPVKTFTIGFHEAEYNEADHAHKVANYLKTDHYEHYLHIDDALSLIEQIPQYFDEPFADSSQLPTMLVSQVAREEVKVVLSGDGGDELFCGYTRYDEALQYWKLRKLFKVIGQLDKTFNVGALLNVVDLKYKKLLHLSSLPNIVNHRYILSQHYTQGLVKNTYFSVDEQYQHMLGLSNNVQEAFMLQDMLTYLPDDIMAKVDKATMSVGLEGREPLLDHRLFEFSFKLSHHLKYNNGQKKYLLKKLAHQYIPKQLLDRPKKGFSLPIHQWLKKDLYFLVEKYLSRQYILEQNIFDYQVVSFILKEFYKEKVRGKYATLVWHLIVFQLWYQKYCIY